MARLPGGNCFTTAVLKSGLFGWNSRKPPDRQQPGGFVQMMFQKKRAFQRPTMALPCQLFWGAAWLLWEALLLFTVLTWSGHCGPTLATALIQASLKEVQAWADHLSQNTRSAPARSQPGCSQAFKEQGLHIFGPPIVSLQTVFRSSYVEAIVFGAKVYYEQQSSPLPRWDGVCTLPDECYNEG